MKTVLLVGDNVHLIWICFRYWTAELQGLKVEKHSKSPWTLLHILLQNTLDLFDTFLFIHSKQQHPKKPEKKCCCVNTATIPEKRIMGYIYSKAAHSHNLYCIGHIITHIYTQLCVYICTCKEYIKTTMKSSHRAIYRLNIFFTLCLKENFNILQSFSRHYIHCTLWNRKGTEINLFQHFGNKTDSVSANTCAIYMISLLW